MNTSIKNLTVTFLLVLLSACTTQTAQKEVNATSGQVVQSKAATEEQKLQLLTESSVESIQIVGGLPGTKGSDLFKKADAKESTVISKVIGWLNSSVPTDGPTDVGRHGYPLNLKIIMTNADTAEVEPAYNCVTQTNDDGSSSKTCSVVKREVIYTHDKSSIRLISPELYDWLQEGWKQEK